MTAPRDTGYAPQRWAFDEEVTRVFDDMLRRSIPDYDRMRALVLALGSRFVRRGLDVIDLGASRGESIAALLSARGSIDGGSYVAVEVSEPMRRVCEERFAQRIALGDVRVTDVDLREGFPDTRGASLVLSVLTLQFVPIEHRARVVADAFESLALGGAMIVVEKVLGGSARMDELLVAEYLSHKAAHGYSETEIRRKRLALEGVLVPVTADWNVDLLRRAGFRDVECFWRHLNFAAWLAVK